MVELGIPEQGEAKDSSLRGKSCVPGGTPDPGLAGQDSFGPSLQDTLYVWADCDHRTKDCSFNIQQ